MADAMKTTGQHMQQDAAPKPQRLRTHGDERVKRSVVWQARDRGDFDRCAGHRELRHANGSPRGVRFAEQLRFDGDEDRHLLM